MAHERFVAAKVTQLGASELVLTMLVDNLLKADGWRVRAKLFDESWKCLGKVRYVDLLCVECLKSRLNCVEGRQIGEMAVTKRSTMNVMKCGSD